MTSKKLVEEFLLGKTIAVVGASKSSKKFGNAVYKNLKAKGYNVYPVNPNADYIDNDKCYPSLLALQGKVDSAIFIIPPRATYETVKDALSAGIKRIWMQQGSESEEAINYCKEVGIDVIHSECILMFAEPAAFIHRTHRWINGVFGKLPR